MSVPSDEAGRSGDMASRQPGAAWLERPAAAPPSWSAGLVVPEYLALREGTRAVIVVAPHGGRRQRPLRRGDSVNDLQTAEIAWELAERVDAHAIVNHGLDRNDIDLNRITHLATRAPEVLALLTAAIVAAGRGDAVPIVLFVHGWNMVVPCCDIGIGITRRRWRLTGRYPTLSRARFDSTIAAIESELGSRGLSTAFGRHYAASGSDNAAQLFSGRYTSHHNDAVAALARLAVEEKVDAAQLELGIPLRWPGRRRTELLDGLAAALEVGGARAPKETPSLRAVRDDAAPSGAIVEVPRSSSGWRLHARKRNVEAPALEAGFAFQAVMHPEGRLAAFCGVEATGRRSMAARLSLVSTDGSMMLLVGEGEWSGEPGRYNLEGFDWRTSADERHVELTVRAPMIHYATHEAYLDLEKGLSTSRLVDADVQLVYDAISDSYGRLRGHVRTAQSSLEVSTIAFIDRGRRIGAAVEARVRVVASRPDASPVVVRSVTGPGATLELDRQAGALGTIRRAPASRADHAMGEAEILAKVPLWRPLADGNLARWTFGIVRCRLEGPDETVYGLFDSTELFPRPRAIGEDLVEPSED